MLLLMLNSPAEVATARRQSCRLVLTVLTSVLLTLGTEQDKKITERRVLKAVAVVFVWEFCALVVVFVREFSALVEVLCGS